MKEINYDYFNVNIMDAVNRLVKQIEQLYGDEAPIKKNNIDSTGTLMGDLLVEMVDAVKTELDVGT